MNELTVQFSRETDWDAVINHWSLNIVEEDSFLSFVVDNGCTKQSSLEQLEMLYFEWEKHKEGKDEG